MLDPLALNGAGPICDFFSIGRNSEVTRGCEYPNVRQRGCRPRCLASFKASKSCGRLAESSLHWYLRLGIFELETGILSSTASSTEVLGVLRDSIELRRSELHLPPVANREDACRLAGRDRRWLSLLVQGAAADHSHSSAQGLLRRSRRLGACTRSSRGCSTDGSGALPASTQFQGRHTSPRFIPCGCGCVWAADDIRISAQHMVL